MNVTNLHSRQSEVLVMRSSRRIGYGWPLLAFSLLAATGCHNIVDDVSGPTKENFPPVQKVAPGNQPGLPVNAAPPNLINDLVTNYKTTTRPNVFALNDQEQEFETKARNELVFSTTGGLWKPVFIEKPEVVVTEQVEPQPFRRLAGVLVGDSVEAIIDMGDNGPMQLIRPGMQVPNSPWRVISIDSEKAILRRGGTIKPNEIVVRLQGPISSGPGNPVGPGGGNPGGGNPGGGNPGNPGGPPANPGGGRGRFGGGGRGGGGIN